MYSEVMTETDRAPAGAASQQLAPRQTALEVARHAGAAGTEPPPAWRQVGCWPHGVPPHPDAGSPHPWWWAVGLHGGAGASSLVTALPGGGDARRLLPTGVGQSPYTLLVARTHHEGLRAAQDFSRQRVCGLVPPTVRILGLVLMADAEKRPDKGMRQFQKVVAGAYGRVWHIPWVAAWRTARPDPQGVLPPAVTDLSRELVQITGQPTA